jgi:hypothetical protein
MDRTTLIKGPAIVEYNPISFYSQGDITVTVAPETFDVMADAYGLVDVRVKERRAEISFTPVGEWDTNTAATLWPYASTRVGSSIIGATDKPLTIWPLNDGTGSACKKITFENAFVSAMPQLVAAATRTAIGAVTLTAIGKLNTAWTDANSFYTIGTGTRPTVALDPALIQTEAAAAAWGTTPWDAIQTMDGWVVDFNMSTSAVETDADGIIDYHLDRLDVSAKAKVAVLTEAQFLDALVLQGASAKRGQSLAALSADRNLVLTTTKFTFTAYKAMIKTVPLVFGRQSNRVGDAEWVATRELNTGAINDLFLFA